jgi:predicted nucleotidyltransferase component of viral defense system
MAYTEDYRRQVALLIRILPFVGEEACFALKGGTAINLFIRDLPRLSVDIDLTYLPVKSRPESLAEINAAMKRIEGRIKKGLPDAAISRTSTEDTITKLLVREDGVQIKIEVTPVLRGCVFEPEVRDVSAAVEEGFGFASIQLVSFPDLYAGKLVAALDRQHPRDLFDVRDLLDNEGIEDDLRDAFIVYLISHDRPMSETLNARRKDIGQLFERNFAGMTAEPVKLDDLLQARERMIEILIGDMPARHKEFLIGFEKGTPDWSLLGLKNVDQLPAVLWRQKNLDLLSAERRATLVADLETALKDFKEKT